MVSAKIMPHLMRGKQEFARRKVYITAKAIGQRGRSADDPDKCKAPSELVGIAGKEMHGIARVLRPGKILLPVGREIAYECVVVGPGERVGRRPRMLEINGRM